MLYDDKATVQIDGNVLSVVLSYTPIAVPEGRVTVEIDKWKPRRSLSSNAMFHALCGEIARLTGMDRELVKEGIKEQYGPRMKYHDRMVVKPSHLCDTGEMTELIRGAEIELLDAGGDPRRV